jgi:transposase-like protein
MPKPSIDIRRIKKMIAYRKYLGARETARIMDVDIKTIYRWEKYLKGEIKVSKKSVGKLSTVINLTRKSNVVK